MVFKYEIDQSVMIRSVAEDVLKCRGIGERKEWDSCTVQNRISEECVGGTQLFYRLQRWDGLAAPLYPEAALMPLDDFFEALLKVMQKKD